MAEGDGVVYNNFKEQLMEGAFNLLTDAVTVTLHTGYSPNIDTHTLWADVSATEYGTGSGYTAGGITLTNKIVEQDNATDRGYFDNTVDSTWTSLGPLTPATPSHAIIKAGSNLIGYWVLGTTATNGGNYTLQYHANGIVTIA
jgi:hypothetical protein